MKNFLISFIPLLFVVLIQFCLAASASAGDEEGKELGIWNKVDELAEDQSRRIKRCYCGGYGSYGYGGGYPSYGGGYGYPYGGGFGGGMPYGFGSPFGGFYS